MTRSPCADNLHTWSQWMGEPTATYRWIGWVWEITGEVQDLRKVTIHFKGIHGIYLKLDQRKPERSQHVTRWTWKHEDFDWLCPTNSSPDTARSLTLSWSRNLIHGTPIAHTLHKKVCGPNVGIGHFQFHIQCWPLDWISNCLIRLANAHPTYQGRYTEYNENELIRRERAAWNLYNVLHRWSRENDEEYKMFHNLIPCK